MSDQREQPAGEHIDALIDAYVLGALDDAEMAQVEDHLETCARCRALLRTARETADALLLAGPLVAPPPSLRAKVLARVHALAEDERRGVGPMLRARPGRAAARQGLLARLLGRRVSSGERDETLEQLAALLANPESLVWEVAGTEEA
ncbi:MAG TPA: zf-HC2 domain-containing protein, partial [Ktedonobacterales bacterium]